MAVPSTYLASTKNLSDILAAMQKAAVPGRITYEWLKQLGFPSSNDRPLIPLMKALGFLDTQGVPQDRYRRFRDGNNSRFVMAEGLREAYADVFAIDQQAQTLGGDELKGLFARLSGKSDSVVEKMATTFKALTAHADFTADRAAPSGSDAAKETGATNDVDETHKPRVENEHEAAGLLRLHHDIHVHLPESTEVAVYDAIFKALRENFGT